MVDFAIKADAALEALKTPMTIKELVNWFRQNRIGGYGFWAPVEINYTVCSLERQGLVKNSGYRQFRKVYVNNGEQAPSAI